MSLTEPLRVGYVVKRFPRYSETFVVNEILAHEAAGWPVEIFSLRAPNDTHFQNALARLRAPVRYIPAEGLRAADFWAAVQQAGSVAKVSQALDAAWGADACDVYQALALAHEICSRDIAHLHAHFATSAATVARLASRVAGVPYTVTAHAKDIFHDSVDPHHLGQTMADAAAVVTVSDFNVRYLREMGWSSATPIHRIYNGLDVRQLTYAPPRGREPSIVAVGRLVEKKGFSYLVEACAQLAARRRAFTCRIIGTGELEAALRDQIASLNLEAGVELVGPRPQADVIDAIRAAAVMAAPCLVGTDGNRDGLPTTILEAMALGTPCVSTDVTGIPEVVQHDETGLLVSQRDPLALAAALERLLEDEELRVRLAGRARRLIEAEFDIVPNSERLRQIFLAASPRRALAAAAACQVS